MSSQTWTFLGVLVTVVGGFAIAIWNTRRKGPTDRTASAAEVTALGARLDIAVARMDRQDRTIRGLYDYIADDHVQHRANGWPITPLPKDLA